MIELHPTGQSLDHLGMILSCNLHSSGNLSKYQNTKIIRLWSLREDGTVTAVEIFFRLVQINRSSKLEVVLVILVGSLMTCERFIKITCRNHLLVEDKRVEEKQLTFFELSYRVLCLWRE